ncbi:MAG: long-chain fatty acid--CoA ligase, partial [Gammaproteobacteria bacterium]|nr:long-chain fatty acid--CoA ligase [Gammaproteobacteria bacterium]
FEQAALRLGLVVVPLYPNDRADNVVHIVNQTASKVILHRDIEQWRTLEKAKDEFTVQPRIVSILDIEAKTKDSYPSTYYKNWIAGIKPEEADDSILKTLNSTDLATIVYTSGTTGLPKGVMLSHKNIVQNAFLGLKSVKVYREDLFLSFLPLSHTLERTVGYYIPMISGATVAFSRSIPQLGEDLVTIKPTIIISVPRIFERVYAKVQAGLAAKSPIAKKLFLAAVATGWRRFEAGQGRASYGLTGLYWPILNKLVASKVLEKLGGRMRFAICGGAPLPPAIAETFIGLGLQILQGYGLTEASPVISVNHLDKNIPASIGPAFYGVQVRIAPDGELQTKSDCVMLGYWKNEQATKDTFTDDGWLMTGDLAEIRGDHIFITGRKKEILVLSNGEKVPPVDIEMAIALDPLFEQAMVIGEGKPYLTAVIVLCPDTWPEFAQKRGVDPEKPESLRKDVIVQDVLNRVRKCMSQFPGYAQIHKITLTTDVWTDGNEMLTASLKLRRVKVFAKFDSEIKAMYTGH